MANTLVLRSRALPTAYHHNQFQCTISSYPRNLFLQHPPYKTQVSSTTLFLQKPYNNINPKTLVSSSKPFISNHVINPKLDHNNNNEQVDKTSPKNPLELILDAITRAIKSLRKPAAAAVLVCLLMIIHDRSRYPAWAASGGCMGGDSFGSWSSSSDSSSSGSSWSSSSDSSSSWSSSSSGDSGSSWSSSSSSNYGGSYESKPWTEEEKKAFWREFWSFLGYVVATISALAAFWAVLDDQMVTARERNSIIKLQIGVLVTGRKLQSELNQIALTADTSTKKGISNVLTETIRVLLQHDDYFMSAYLSVNTKRRIWDGRSLFKQLSLEERKKFDEETLVNLNNVKKHVTKSAETTGISSDFIVITLLVAVTGVLKLPTIKRTVELKEALQKLGSIPYNETIAAQVLWTPQVENETLSEEELSKDYPHLKPLEDDLKI